MQSKWLWIAKGVSFRGKSNSGVQAEACRPMKMSVAHQETCIGLSHNIGMPSWIHRKGCVLHLSTLSSVLGHLRLSGENFVPMRREDDNMLVKGVIGAGIWPGGCRMKLTERECRETRGISPRQSGEMVNAFQDLDWLSSIHSKTKEQNSSPDFSSLLCSLLTTLAHAHSFCCYSIWFGAGTQVSAICIAGEHPHCPDSYSFIQQIFTYTKQIRSS